MSSLSWSIWSLCRERTHRLISENPYEKILRSMHNPCTLLHAPCLLHAHSTVSTIFASLSQSSWPISGQAFSNLVPHSPTGQALFNARSDWLPVDCAITKDSQLKDMLSIRVSCATQHPTSTVASTSIDSTCRTLEVLYNHCHVIDCPSTQEWAFGNGNVSSISHI